MKHGKKPTVSQKKFLRSKGLNPDNWLIIKNLPDRMEVIHRESVRARTIWKDGAGK